MNGFAEVSVMEMEEVDGGALTKDQAFDLASKFMAIGTILTPVCPVVGPTVAVFGASLYLLTSAAIKAGWK